MKEKFVRLTKRKIEEIFDACNKAYFNNEVEKPVCLELWTPNINIIGMVRPVLNVKKKVFFSALHISLLIPAYLVEEFLKTKGRYGINKSKSSVVDDMDNQKFPQIKKIL